GPLRGAPGDEAGEGNDRGQQNKQGNELLINQRVYTSYPVARKKPALILFGQQVGKTLDLCLFLGVCFKHSMYLSKVGQPGA
ncbi:MAG: hypothetical protein XD69_0578, partial [Clostridia bacterium 62_21]